jgi:hypothetical protein
VVPSISASAFTTNASHISPWASAPRPQLVTCGAMRCRR